MSRYYRWVSLLVVSIPSVGLGLWVSPVPALVIIATMLGLSMGLALAMRASGGVTATRSPSARRSSARRRGR
jgi:hypothetical protein